MVSSIDPAQLGRAIEVVHYTYAPLIFVYFILTQSVSLCTLQTKKLRVKDQHARRDILLWFALATIATYVIEAIIAMIRSLVHTGYTADQDYIVFLLASVLVWGMEFIILVDTKFPVWYPYYGTWFLTLAIEISLAVFFGLLAPNRTFDRVFDSLQFSMEALRICLLVLLPAIFFIVRNSGDEYDDSQAERQSLLRKKLAPKPGSDVSTEGNGYGATGSGSETAEDDNASDAGSECSWEVQKREARERLVKRLEDDGDWWTYAKSFVIFVPYVWPFHSKSLQARAVLVGICLLTTNFLNVLTPRQLGIATDSLLNPNGTSPWLAVGLYILFRLANSYAGLLWLKKWLWLPLEQYSYGALSTAAHAHVMSLSSEFHDSKTSAEVSGALNQGRSVSDIVETVVLEVIPMLIDLTFAFAYLYWAFGPYMALITAFTAVTYLYTTTKLVAMRTPIRREHITKMRKEWTVGQQSLDGWRTASLFNNIPYEDERYSDAVHGYLTTRSGYSMSYYSMYAIQALIMTLGLLGGCLLAVYQVTRGIKSPGMFVMLLTYWAQLSAPLQFFSGMYTNISGYLINAERLLELFQTKPSIVNAPNARPLKLKDGRVKFENVYFSYDPRKQTLKGLNFEVEPGTTVALVGETGSGKSTILKLLDRFYDVTGGAIKIDGQDIRDVTLGSLRDAIGVVPQDPALFNDTVMSNIKYAKLNASNKEVEEACRAAAIHEKIISFPDGYKTKVGEHGVKLSGGEQQRLAIARAILKRPEIILLDEATSAVDTETESLIQEALGVLCKNRTTFIVAHRLSTIMRADQIMVIKNGEVVENGSHHALIHAKGKYHDLWAKQIFVEPISETGKSKSEGKQDVNIVNDISPSRGKMKLSDAFKLLHSEKTTGQGSGTQTPVNKVPASPKLKADAPTFVPRHLQSSTDVTDDSDDKQSDKDKKKLEKERKKQEKDAQKEAQNLLKQATKKAGKISIPDDTKDSEDDASSSKSLLRPVEPPVNPKPKRVWSRRNNAKSEPANRRTDNSSFDGASDTTVASTSHPEVHNGDTESSGSNQRRISTPSDPPSGTGHPRAPGQERNRRRRRQNLRLKGTRTGSSLVSEFSLPDSTSGSAPTVPVTSPAEGPPPQNTTFANRRSVASQSIAE